MSTERESSEIIREAAARGERHETYDPNHLISDVRELLNKKGLHPNATGHLGMALGGAGMLLRAFGIVPNSDFTSIDRINAPDPDDR